MARYYALATRPWIVEGDDEYWGLPPGTIGAVDLSAVGSHDVLFVTSDQPFNSADVLVQFGDGTTFDQLGLNGGQRNSWAVRTGVPITAGMTLLDAVWDILTVNADPTGLTRAKPIMPTHLGVLELHLGGHSLVRSEKLPDDPTTHPAWANIQAVLQADYRKLQSYNPIVARKWLGNEQRRYKLTPEHTRDLIVPSDLPRVLPLRPETTIADDFNRVDQSDLGSSAEGWSWNTINLDIVSNQAVTEPDVGGVGRAESDLSSADHYAEVLIPSLADDKKRGGPAVRYDSSTADAIWETTHTAYYAEKRDTATWSNQLRLFKRDGTQLATAASSNATPLTVRLEADGSSLSVYENGALALGPYTDTAYTGIRTGVQTRFAMIVDDFVAADLAAATALPALALGTYTNVSLTAITGSDPVLELIASKDDADFVFDNDNSSHTGTARFALQDMPTDFVTMGTLAVRLRYALSAAASNNTWDALRARVFKSDGTTALTNAVTVVSGPITTTTITNSSVVAFTGLDTAATKADWDAAVVHILFDISKNKGGDSVEERVYAAELTGTYTAAVAATSFIFNPRPFQPFLVR